MEVRIRKHGAVDWAIDATVNAEIVPQLKKKAYERGYTTDVFREERRVVINGRNQLRENADYRPITANNNTILLHQEVERDAALRKAAPRETVVAARTLKEAVAELSKEEMKELYAMLVAESK